MPRSSAAFLLFFALFVPIANLQAMTEGRLVDPSADSPLRAIRAILISLGDDEALCTGTALNDQTLITAGHCVKLDEVKLHPKIRVRDAETLAIATEIRPFTELNLLSDDDVAVVVFPKGTFGHLKHFPKISMIPETQTQFWIAGVGTKTISTPSDLKLFEAPTGAQDRTTLEKDRVAILGGPSFPLAGDSGGALLSTENGAFISGIIFGTTDAEPGPDTRSYFSRIDSHRKLLFLNQLISDGVPLPTVDCVCSKIADTSDPQWHAKAIDVRSPDGACSTLPGHYDEPSSVLGVWLHTCREVKN